MKSIITFFVCILFATNINAQTRYIIKFKDKGTNPFSIANPSAYLGPRTLQRRLRYNIAIDSLDLPVTPRYVDSVRLAGAVTILNTSKWLNQVTIKTTDAAALVKINSLPFVVSSTAVASFTSGQFVPVNKMLDAAIDVPIPSDNSGNSFTAETTDNTYSYGKSNGQVHIHQGEFLHNHGFRGEGMQISVLDAGFFHYLSLPTFDSIRANNQIINTWDFVANNASVDEDNTHGMNCLSTIAANMPGVFVGTAPKANFCLFRTEDVASETRIEEHNLSAGYERADSIGVDVCTISLGYTTFDFPSQNYAYANMDGNTTMAAIASDIAAKKGMLPVVAAGNDGNGAWHYISTPADADSVMTVGAVDTLGIIGSFSSYGPSSNGRIKPNVAAVGRAAVIASPSTGLPVFGNGTSFATPNIAGLTTCLWQAFPEFNNMTILDAMQRSASKYTTPDDRVGYGIPDMKKSFAILLKKSYTQNYSLANCATSVLLNIKHDSSMTIMVERKLSTQTVYSNFKTIFGSGNFTNKSVSFIDDLSLVNGSNVSYRIRLDIATDTSFYLDSLVVNFPTKPNLGIDKIIAKCDNNIVDLTTQFNTIGLTNLSWTTNGTNVSNPAVVNNTGIYQLIVNNTIGCKDTALVTINSTTTINIGADKIINKCTDSSINLTTVFVTAGLNSIWKFNAVTVANPSSISVAGAYQLIVSNTFGCADTALVTVTNDQTLCPVLGITMAPNPVIDILKIKVFKNVAAKIDISIINMVGQKIYFTSNKQTAAPFTYFIPMSKLSAGIYYVSVSVDGKVDVVKRVLKR
jgi:serine protease AprX